MSGTGGGAGEGGRPRGGLFDDLAGVAGGVFSALAGARQEAEAMARSQFDAMVQRLELVRRDELDAALEVARRAREAAEALEARVAALEARLGAAPAQPAAAAGVPEGTIVGGTVPEGDAQARASLGMPGVGPEDLAGRS